MHPTQDVLYFNGLPRTKKRLRPPLEKHHRVRVSRRPPQRDQIAELRMPGEEAREAILDFRSRARLSL
ncbi:MAG: hypothetical protein RL077_1959 [Verrucomicrobiota bacterium]|jgi:hypothetical protein